MNETLYILMPDGQNAPYPEEHVRYWWSQGSLPRDAMYWKQGMPEWRPLMELLGAPPLAQAPMPAATPYAQPVSSTPIYGQAQPITQSVSRPAFYFVKDPVGLTKTLQVMLVIFFVVCLLQFGANAMQYAMLETGRRNTMELDENAIRQGAISLLSFLSILSTAIVFGRWIYSANLNVRGFGAQNLQFTPGWAVDYYFVPIFNLFRPYQAMREIWQASKNPQNWQGEGGYGIVKVWWGLWLLSALLSFNNIRSSYNSGFYPQITLSTTMADILINCVDIVLTIAAMKMTSDILTMQQRVVGQKT